MKQLKHSHLRSSFAITHCRVLRSRWWWRSPCSSQKVADVHSQLRNVRNRFLSSISRGGQMSNPFLERQDAASKSIPYRHCKKLIRHLPKHQRLGYGAGAGSWRFPVARGCFSQNCSCGYPGRRFHRLCLKTLQHGFTRRCCWLLLYLPLGLHIRLFTFGRCRFARWKVDPAIVLHGGPLNSLMNMRSVSFDVSKLLSASTSNEEEISTFSTSHALSSAEVLT